MSADADVIVVGGGPAGSTAAALLARRGWDVLLLDRHGFPRPKACGECIGPGGVAALRRLGLLDDVLALEPARLVGWDVESATAGRPEGEVEDRVFRRAIGRFGPEVGRGVAVERSRLDAVLLEAARRDGVRVETGFTVRSVRAGAGPRGAPPASVEARDPGGRSVLLEAPVVVGADGLRSVTARAIGGRSRPSRLRKVSLTARVRGDGPPEDRGRLVLTDEGTVGLAPVAPGQWNVTVVVDSDRFGRSVAADAAGFHERFSRSRIREWNPSHGPADAPVTVAGPWASGPFDQPMERVAAGRVVLVGDAAGYFDPLTGQGIFRALRSAELAAPAVDDVLRGAARPRLWAAYGHDVDRAFTSGRRLQRAIEAVLARPRARHLVLRVLGRSPDALSALIRVTGDARPFRSLLTFPVLAALAAGVIAGPLPESNPPAHAHCR